MESICNTPIRRIAPSTSPFSAGRSNLGFNPCAASSSDRASEMENSMIPPHGEPRRPWSSLATPPFGGRYPPSYTVAVAARRVPVWFVAEGFASGRTPPWRKVLRPVELDLEGPGVSGPCHEAQQLFPFLGQHVAVILRQHLERLDRERRLPAGHLRPPRSPDETAYQKSGRDHAVRGGYRPAVIVRKHTGAVGMGEDQVVESGYEARRSRYLRIGPRGVWQVEQLLAAFVAERLQARSQPLENLAQPGQARPGLRVHDARRSERAEVTQHQLVRRGVRIKRTAEPGFDRGVGDGTAPPPQTVGRHLYQRHQVADGAGERDGVVVGPPLPQEPSE